MKTIKLIIILLSVTISSSLVSCGTDEPSLPNKDNEWNNSDWNNSNNDNNGEDNPSSNIEGSEILGTWYYLSPDEAIKIEIRFTSETYLLGHKCFVSVDSKFPSYTSDNMKSWEYKDNKWKIVSLDIGGPFLPSLIIENVFDDEMWADLVRGSSQRLKFKRKDMGQPSTPTGKVLAPDGFFGNYVWNGYVSGYN
ncbi:MAG: hypothetical protein K2N28_10695, partial [Muribaculaceae bacterium]|nr:hypothetical protein [Muribaculaceae bacterium]